MSRHIGQTGFITHLPYMGHKFNLPDMSGYKPISSCDNVLLFYYFNLTMFTLGMLYIKLNRLLSTQSTNTKDTVILYILRSGECYPCLGARHQTLRVGRLPLHDEVHEVLVVDVTLRVFLPLKQLLHLKPTQFLRKIHFFHTFFYHIYLFILLFMKL